MATTDELLKLDKIMLKRASNNPLSWRMKFETFYCGASVIRSELQKLIEQLEMCHDAKLTMFGEKGTITNLSCPKDCKKLMCCNEKLQNIDSLRTVYLHLMAIALELLIKSILIRPKQPNGSLNMETHGLLKLLEKDAYLLDSLDEQQKDLLDRLSSYTVWAGRYPAPKKNQIEKPEKLRRKDGKREDCILYEEWDQIELIYKKLNENKIF